eukprot:6851290-Prymnesium_polylepis.1
MALHAKLSAAGSRVKSVCAEPGVAATDLQKNLKSNHSRVKQWLFATIDTLLSWSGKFEPQSAADGACSLMVAAFDPRTGSGDFWMPSKVVPGKPFSVHGTPARSIEGGKATTTHQWIVDKFESEALTLSPANHATLWAASEKAVGETWVIPA